MKTRRTCLLDNPSHSGPLAGVPTQSLSSLGGPLIPAGPCKRGDHNTVQKRYRCVPRTHSGAVTKPAAFLASQASWCQASRCRAGLSLPEFG